MIRKRSRLQTDGRTDRHQGSKGFTSKGLNKFVQSEIRGFFENVSPGRVKGLFLETLVQGQGL